MLVHCLRSTNRRRALEHAGEPIGSQRHVGKASGPAAPKINSSRGLQLIPHRASIRRPSHHPQRLPAAGSLTAAWRLRARPLTCASPNLTFSHSTARTMASLYVWSTRCVPAFSICLVAVLLVLSFVVSPYGRGHNGQHTGRATTSQLILSIYTAFLHLLSIAFPIRVCWSMRDYLRRMRAAAHDSLSPDTNGSTGQKEKPEGATDDPVPLFIIILPAYKEEVATLEETLRVLASHSQARTSYHVRSTFCALRSALCVGSTPQRRRAVGEPLC